MSMSCSLPSLTFAITLAAATALPFAAQAQDVRATPSMTAGSAALGVPTGGRGYLGLNAGRPEYRMGCSVSASGCDFNDISIRRYAGAVMGTWWGTEIGAIDMPYSFRSSGTSQVQGLNLSLVGRAALGHSFRLFGKLGATYGHTDVGTASTGAATTGSDSGFGLSYGAGVSYDFSPKLSATLGWDSYEFRLPGIGREPVRATSLGLQYRY